MAPKKKTVEADALVAATSILVDGKAFEAGQPVTDVDADQIARAVSDRRVITKAEFDELVQGVPAPVLTGHLAPDEELALNKGEPEAPAAEDDNGGSGE